MTLARVKTWAKERLTILDLNKEFDNIINHMNANEVQETRAFEITSGFSVAAQSEQGIQMSLSMAEPGDFVTVQPSVDLQGLAVSAHVPGPNFAGFILIKYVNNTGSSVSIPSHTIYARRIKP